MQQGDVLLALARNLPHPLVLVGDPGQLGPIASDDDERDDVFRELVRMGFAGKLGAFGNLMNAANLRTDPEYAGILDLAWRIRQFIQLPPTDVAAVPLDPDNGALRQITTAIEEVAAGGRGVRLVRQEEAIARYVRDYRAGNVDGSSVIITGTHDMRNKLNREVRRQLGFVNSPLVVGETLIIESQRPLRIGGTGSDVVLTNNEIVRVVKVHETNAEVNFGHPILGMQKLVGVSCDVSRDGDGTNATIFVPHATLDTSPKVNRHWRQGYASAYNQLKASARQIMKHGDRAATYAALSLFSGQRMLRLPKADGGWEDHAWSKLGIPSTFQFDLPRQLHWFFGQFQPFLPHQVMRQNVDVPTRYTPNDRALASYMVALSEAHVAFAHYGYAITGHASQGTQFTTVYARIDPPALGRYREAPPAEAARKLQSMLRWIYVVATRAQRSLQIMDVRLANFERRPDTPDVPLTIFGDTDSIFADVDLT